MRVSDEEAAISPAENVSSGESLDGGMPEEEPLLKNSESCTVKLGLYHQVLRILGFCVRRWTQKPESSLGLVFLCPRRRTRHRSCRCRIGWTHRPYAHRCRSR
jgi:hypothetical protein